jgi:hypothetical protein
MAKGFSNVDGKLLRTVILILSSPGKLTAAHIRGERRRFIGPLALFLVANGFFVAVQALTGTNVLSTSLYSHLHQQDWSAVAQGMVRNHLAAEGRSLPDFAPAFDNAVFFNAKALMILMVLAFAPLLALVFRRRHQPAGAHVVFALHLYSFVLALLCVSVLLAYAELLLGGDGIRSRAVDLALSLFNVSACATYIYLAIQPAYAASGVRRLGEALALATAVAVLFVGYRFAIFVLTLYTA